MKTCYFIQCHRNPNQIYRLVSLIKSSSSSALVLVWFDSSKIRLDSTVFQGFSDIYLLEGNFPVERGEFSMLLPYLDAIDWLFETNTEFDWLVYMTGQCYPVQPIPVFEEFLATTENHGFIEYFNVLSNTNRWGAREGYLRYYYQKLINLPDWMQLPAKILAKSQILNFTPFLVNCRRSFHLSLWLEAQHHPFTDGFICYGGNHRHTLSRKCVQYLRDFIKSNPKLIEYYRKTVCPEESLVQTVLANSKKFNFKNDNKIYDDYSSSIDGSPRTLKFEDYATITSGIYFFARKFEQDAEILNLLDEKVHGLSLIHI